MSRQKKRIGNYAVMIIDLNRVPIEHHDLLIRRAGISVHGFDEERSIDILTDEIERLKKGENRGS
jgi:hypothetical protein